MTLIDRLVKSETYKRNVYSSSYEKFKKILKRLFVELFKTALSLRATTKTKVLAFVCFDLFVIVLLMEIIAIS